MKLGLGSYAFRWSIGIGDRRPAEPLTPFDLLDIAAAHGLSVVQFADNMPIDRLSVDRQSELKARADALGLKIELGTQSFRPEEIERYVEIAARLDARLLRVALDAEDALIPLPELAAGIRRLMDRDTSGTLRFAIENHFNYPSPRLVKLMETVDDPRLGVCLDVANSICAGEWPLDTVRMLAPFAVNLHLKDYRIVPDPYGVGFRIVGTPLGEGRAEITEILAILGTRLETMSVILEHWLPFGESQEQTCRLEPVWFGRTVAAARRFLGPCSGG